MREKLIELLKQAQCCSVEELADYLIAAGITVPVGEIDFAKILPFEVGNTIRISLPKDKKIMTYNGEEVVLDYKRGD